MPNINQTIQMWNNLMASETYRQAVETDRAVRKLFPAERLMEIQRSIESLQAMQTPEYIAAISSVNQKF